MITSTSPSQDAGEVGALTGRAIGEFVLRNQIGAGGYGDVYVAQQVGLRRDAIIKVLRPGGGSDRRARFLREAQLASRLDHPYAAHIYAFGVEPGDTFWIAMEHVRGTSLRAALEEQPMGLERLVPLLEKICEVVQTAHDQGIIHRDLKPDNVMVISRAGRLLPKLLDLGIARATDGDDLDQPTEIDTEDLDRPAGPTTERGAVLGSPPYMAPELWSNAHSAGPAADQYALAALAFEALTGRPAFAGTTVMQVARAHAKSEIQPLGDGLPSELAVVLRRALSRKPDARYGNVLEFAQAFRAASGVGAAALDLPQIDEALRMRFLTGAPQPLAEAVAAYDAARNAHQAREAMRGIARTAAWYVGILALACRTRIGSGAGSDSEHGKRLLRDLRRQGLTSAGWVGLAKQMTDPFVKLPDTYPIPELVLLLHTADADPFAAVLEGSLAESLADSSEQAASLAIARELTGVTALLRASAFLLDYTIVVPNASHGESWMGARSGSRRTVSLRRELPAQQPVIVDAAGDAIVSLWPLVQVHVAVPGRSDQMFLLAGPGRDGARLLSTPHGFERRDDTLWDWFRDHLFADEGEHPNAAVIESPYRGLEAYTTNEAGWFFGRERESEALVNRLKLEALVAIVGPSGVGKSSFVQAGVVPALADWRVVTIRPGKTPVAHLRTQLAHAGIEGDTADDIREWAAARAGLLIVIDQFEELFTLGSTEDERAQFVELLTAATRSRDDHVRIVLTLRDDFLIHAQQLPGFDVVLARGLQLLGPLNAAALERIVVEPARRAGYEFEDPLLPRRMVEASSGTTAAVALISFAASRLWELRDRHFHQLPRKAYEALGGVSGALAQHADQTVEAMPAAERALVRKAFRHLVTFEGTRAVLERNELSQLLGGGPEVERVIERLITSRLIVTSENDAGKVVLEIVHEALIGAWPRLAEWRREDLEGSRFHEQLRAAAKQWDERRRPRGLLWRGDALAEYAVWRKRHGSNLTPIEASFGAESTADALRGRRLRRALAAIAIVVTAAFLIFLWRANRAEQRLLTEATFDEGRLMMLQGDKLQALPTLAKASRMGDDGDATRFMIEEALRTTRAQAFSLEGHTGRLWGAEYSRDGKTIYTAASDGTVKLWNADTGAVEATLSGDGPMITAAFSPDGTLIATAGRDASVRLWSVHDHREVGKLDIGNAAAPKISSVGFSPDGKLLLAGGDGVLRIWELATKRIVADVPADGEMSGDFVGHGSEVLTWDASGHVVAWNLATNTLARHYDFADGATVARSSPDGTRFAVGTDDGTFILARSDGTLITKKSAHQQGVSNLDFSHDGRMIATVSADKTARLWDAMTGDPIAVLVGHRGDLDGLAFSPKDDLIVTVSADRSARIWSTATGALIGELRGHTNDVVSAVFSPDGSRILTASWDHRAIVWNVARARQFAPIETAQCNPLAPSLHSFSPDGALVSLATPTGDIVIDDVASTKELCRYHHEGPVAQLAWEPNAQRIAIASPADPTVHVVDARSCAIVRELAQPKVLSVAFDHDGRLLAGGADGQLWTWNVATGDVASRVADLPGPISHVGGAPGGSRYYAVTFGKTAAVSLLDPAGSAHETRLIGGKQPLAGVTFDERRHRVLGAGLDQALWVWDADTGALLKKVEATGSLLEILISPDGRSIIGIGGVSPVVWDADSLERLGTLEGHGGEVLAGGFIADGLLVTTGLDSTARIWDVARLSPLETIDGVEGATTSANHRDVVLCKGGVTRLWFPTMPTEDRFEIDGLHPK